MRRIRSLGLLFLFSGCHFFQKCGSMIPDFQRAPINFQKFLPQTADSARRMTADAQCLLKQGIREIIDRPANKRDFGNTLGALDRLTQRVAIVGSIMELLVSVHPDAAMREVASSGLVSIKNALLHEVTTNRELYHVVNEYAASAQRKAENIDAEQTCFLTDTVQDFERSGLNLPDEQLARVRTLAERLVELETNFELNIAKDVRSISVDRAGLEGLPESFVASLKRTDNGGYLLRADMPTNQMVMRSCASSSTREALLLAWQNRAYPENETILTEIIALRDQVAKLIGFESYAHLTIDSQLAKTPERAATFLHDLAARSQDKYEKELALFKTHLPPGVTLTTDGLFKPWDLGYVSECYRREKYGIDMQKIREYFPIQHTLDALFAIYGQFLGLEFREERVNGLWHEDVMHIAIYTKTGEFVGHLLLDLYPRDNKYTHAGQLIVLPATYDSAGARCPAISLILANFSRPEANRPGLLTLTEASTIFHEFGHSMHALLGASKIASFADIASKLDFTEAPSQLFEEWLSEPSILRRLSSHYQTGEPLSEEIIEKLCTLRTLTSGNFVQGHVGTAEFALQLFASGEKKDIEALQKAVHKEYSRGILYDERMHFVCSFGHLMFYGARYYGYFWSLILACDLFASIRQQGLENAATGQRLIETVFTHGNFSDPMDRIRAFLGRESNMDAFLQRFGFSHS